MKNPKNTMEATLQGNDYDQTQTHVEIYNGFTTFMKWSTLSVIGILVLMAIFLV
ncbi:aa3-type cytochrome c oxidase subunit IV [Thalassospira lucentensis]|uniref:aa3-type cytochrome c oxidase subunit IV n=1 Tax=Thalassospira lucentensis TaxID=168935 RepID=UPI001C37C213|nr:aa3-type cytochrome c oxidase subunit IV [Thalassospira lucentensis]